MVRRRKEHRTTDWLLIGGTLAGMLLLLMMQGMTSYTYDDYYYAVFLRNGPGVFLTKNVEHYCLRNGRVLVHAAAELLLAGGSWFYSIGNLVILAGVIFLGMRYLAADVAADWRLQWGSCAAVVMLGSMRVLRSWLLCPADSVNYMLPMLALLGMLLALRRGRPLAAGLLSLLCGATTELYAAMGFTAVAAELAWIRWKEGRWDRARWLSLVCILGGLSTILLSPATQSRVSGELSMAGIGFSFLRYANSIAAPGTSLPLLTAAALLLGTRLPKPLGWSAPAVAALLASGWIVPRNTVFTAISFAVFCGYVLICSGFLIVRGEQRSCGFLLLAGLASAAVMTLSDSGSVRVTIPFVLCLMLVCARLLRQSSLVRPWLRTATGLILCAAVLVQLPNLGGIAGNYQIMQRNEQALRAGRGTYTDYDPRYATQQIFMSRDHQRVYLAYLGLENTPVVYTYAYGPEVELAGAQYPTVCYRDTVYFPLRAVVEAAGGTVKLISDSFLEIRLGDQTFLYQAPMLHTPRGSRDANWDFVSIENCFYISAEVLQEELGLDAAVPEA